MNGFAGALKTLGILAASALLAASLLLASHATAESAPVLPEQVNSIFDMANEEYKAGAYENAVTLYEGLLTSPGIKAADIHYNIGNAAFKLNNHGRAIASYRRALRLAPRDQDIVANLDFVREATLDRIDQPRGTELRRDIFFFHYGLSGAEAEKIFLCAYVAAAGLGSALLVRRSKALRWLTLIALSVTIALGVSCALRWQASANPSEAVVVADEADVHTGPGNHYIVSFDLHDGAELEIGRSEGEWRLIELSDGRRGWIEKIHLEII
jgi:tetratricopeptide (TPR) repeat protein